MTTVTIKRRSTVYPGFLKVDQVTYTIPRFAGGEVEQTREVLERGDSAAALIHDLDSDELVFTEQFRFPVYLKGPETTETGKGWILEAAAGSVPSDEHPDQTMRRELMEETGYDVTKLDLIASFYVSPGGTSERIFLFYAPVRKQDLKNPHASGLASETEDIVSRRFSRATAFAMLDDGKFVDAKTIIGLQWLRLKR